MKKLLMMLVMMVCFVTLNGIASAEVSRSGGTNEFRYTVDSYQEFPSTMLSNFDRRILFRFGYSQYQKNVGGLLAPDYVADSYFYVSFWTDPRKKKMSKNIV